MECSQFRTLLHELISSGTGFKALSDWMVANSGQHIKIISVWCEELGKAKPSQMELFFRLLNLIVRHKDGKLYLSHLRSIIEDVFFRAVIGLTSKDEEVLVKLQEMVQLWHSKDIFGPQTGERLQRCLTTHKKLCRLREMFPSRRDADLQSALGQCNGNFDSVAELISTQEKNRKSLEKSLNIYQVGPHQSWADIVDEDIPEYMNEIIPSPAYQNAMAFDQFVYPKTPMNNNSVVKKRTPVRAIPSAIEYPLKTVKVPDYHIDLSKMGEEEQLYVKALEARVKQLEDIVSVQTEDIARTIRNHNKVDEFMKELRIECARLIQRQLNIDRGHVPVSSSTVFRDTSTEDEPAQKCSALRRSNSSGISSVAGTPRLNPQAIPFVPSVSVASCGMSSEMPSPSAFRNPPRKHTSNRSPDLIEDTTSNCNSDVCVEDDEQTQQSCESLT